MWAELKGPRKLVRIRPSIVDFGPKTAPKPDETKPEMPGAVPKTGTDRVRTGFWVFRPRSKTLTLRESSAESWPEGPHVAHPIRSVLGVFAKITESNPQTITPWSTDMFDEGTL